MNLLSMIGIKNPAQLAKMALQGLTDFAKENPNTVFFAVHVVPPHNPLKARTIISHQPVSTSQVRRILEILAEDTTTNDQTT